MRANPIYLLFLLVTLFSCDDPEKRIYTSAELMNDRVFVSYIETNNAILQKLNNAAGYSEDQRKDYIEKLRTVISNNETNEIYLTLGYKDESEFIELNKKQFDRLQEINSKISGTEDIVNEAIGLSIKKTASESVLTAKSVSGCKGGLPCFRTATDCDHSAEVDFGVASAACTSIGWFPPSWAICQGSAFLVYYAEKKSCADALDACCGMDQPKKAE